MWSYRQKERIFNIKFAEHFRFGRLMKINSNVKKKTFIFEEEYENFTFSGKGVDFNFFLKP